MFNINRKCILHFEYSVTEKREKNKIQVCDADQIYILIKRSLKYSEYAIKSVYIKTTSIYNPYAVYAK